tara:strand:- start:325 stop:648 length:324 start_codon:yes stop_codon:yes gene_type:complete
MLKNKTDWILWARGRAVNMKDGTIMYYTEGLDPDDPTPTVHVSFNDGSVDSFGFTDPYLTHAILPWIKSNCSKTVYNEMVLGIKHTRERLTGVIQEPGIEVIGKVQT